MRANYFISTYMMLVVVVKLSHVSRRPSSSLKDVVTRHDNAGIDDTSLFSITNVIEKLYYKYLHHAMRCLFVFSIFFFHEISIQRQLPHEPGSLTSFSLAMLACKFLAFGGHLRPGKLIRDN